MIHDRYYYAARAAEERQSAMDTEIVKAREAHLELAARYDALVDGHRAEVDVVELMSVEGEAGLEVKRH